MDLHRLMLEIYATPLPRVALWMLLALAGWTVLALLFGGRRRFWRRLNTLAAVLCVLGIFCLTVVFRRGDGTREIVPVPFYSFVEAKVQPEFYRTMLMNVFLFFPLGLTGPFALEGRRPRPWLRAVLLAAGVSLAVELCQGLFGLGRAETDDLLCNTLGAFLGSLAYGMTFRSREKKRNKKD